MKKPSFQFYPGDWRKDQNLSRASLEAKGAMIEIMCLAFESEKRGMLITDKTAWTIEETAHAIGGDKVKNIKAIKELLRLKVLKTDAKKVIYSKRMVEDEKLTKVRREAGSKGGNPKLVNQKVNQTDNQSANQNPTPSTSSSSSTSENTNTGDVPLVGLDGDGLVQDIVQIFKSHFPNYPQDPKRDFPAAFQIAGKIAEANGWAKHELKDRRLVIRQKWNEMAVFASTHKWFASRALSDISNEWQRFFQSFTNPSANAAGKITEPVQIKLR